MNDPKLNCSMGKERQSVPIDQRLQDGHVLPCPSCYPDIIQDCYIAKLLTPEAAFLEGAEKLEENAKQPFAARWQPVRNDNEGQSLVDC